MNLNNFFAFRCVYQNCMCNIKIFTFWNIVLNAIKWVSSQFSMYIKIILISWRLQKRKIIIINLKDKLNVIETKLILLNKEWKYVQLINMH